MSKIDKEINKSDFIEIEEKISNYFEDFMYEWGGSPLLGRIYSLCVLSIPNKPLLQNDFVNKFKVNPSTISRNLRDLEGANFIVKRKDPGTREWKYLVEGTSFLELLVNKFKRIAENLDNRLEDLIRIRNHWCDTLSYESRRSEKGKYAQMILNRLIEWIRIVNTELEDFLKILRDRYIDLEKKLGNTN